jgi:hypothetical protein
MRRGLFLVGLLCLEALCGVLAAGQTATGGKSNRSEKMLGTWKELIPDYSLTLKVEQEVGGIKFSFGCKEDGSCSDDVLAKYDGKRYKASSNANWESSLRKTRDETIELETYFHGKLDNTSKWELSSGRNTLTVTTNLESHPESKAVRFVYERNGGPSSAEDSFIGFWKRDWIKSDPIFLTYTAKADVFIVTGQYGLTDERRCDGRDHPNTNLAGTEYSCGFPDDRTYEVVFKDKGKIVSKVTNKISEDGKKFVRTVQNGEGKTTLERIYEKVK